MKRLGVTVESTHRRLKLQRVNMLALALISPVKGLDVCCVQLGKLQLKLLYLHVKGRFKRRFSHTEPARGHDIARCLTSVLNSWTCISLDMRLQVFKMQLKSPPNDREQCKRCYARVLSISVHVGIQLTHLYDLSPTPLFLGQGLYFLRLMYIHCMTGEAQARVSGEADGWQLLEADLSFRSRPLAPLAHDTKWEDCGLVVCATDPMS